MLIKKKQQYLKSEKRMIFAIISLNIYNRIKDFYIRLEILWLKIIRKKETNIKIFKLKQNFSFSI